MASWASGVQHPSLDMDSLGMPNTPGNAWWP